MRWILRLITHGVALALGVALGIYLLPIELLSNLVSRRFSCGGLILV